MKLEPGGHGGKTVDLGDPRFQVDFNHSYYVASGKPHSLSLCFFSCGTEKAPVCLFSELFTKTA